MAGRRRTVLPIVFLLASCFLEPAVCGDQPPVGQSGPGIAAPTVRVHHLHFVVEDPIAAIQARADRLAGTVVPLPGLGAGVRIGTQYLLFDPSRGSITMSGGLERMQSLFARSAGWLSDHGITVEAADFAKLAALVNDPLPLDHIGFGATGFVSTVNALVARGAVVLSQSGDAAMFALPTGERLEVVKDSGGADAYWCPMHPGVRSATTGTCPLCSMELVAIRPPRIGEYQMDVAVMPQAQRRGLAGLRIMLRDPSNGTPVADLLTVHEKTLHLFIISRDLEYFAHVHPDPQGRGRFVLKHEAPPGEYMIIADFLPRSGTSQMLHRAIVAPRPRRAVSGIEVPAPKPDILEPTSGAGGRTWGSAEKTVNGVRIRLEGADLIGGQFGVLRFHLLNAADGTPISDLEPFLGAPGHMLMTNVTLTDAVHGHPEETGTRTSVITFKPVMPAPGLAKLWIQFQRHGQITAASFVINVLEP